MKYLCTSQNACFSTRAIVNLAVGASICHIFFPTVLATQKAYRKDASNFHFEEQR